MKKRETRKNIYGYLFIAPWLIGFFLITLFPACYALVLSFQKYNILSPAKWVGLKNYERLLFEDPTIWKSMKVTFKYALVSIPFDLIIALLVAILLQKKTKLKGFYRVLFYIPSLMGGTVAVSLTWKKLWWNNGIINNLLETVGLPTMNWLGDTRTALYILALQSIWQFGATMLIFLAGLNDIPSTLVEAAVIDGAGPWKCFFKVKLPMLTPTIFYNLIMGIIGSLQSFNGAFLITDGGPFDSTLFFALYQYKQAFTYMNMGYSSAMAFFFMIIILILTAITFKSQSAWVYYQGED